MRTWMKLIAAFLLAVSFTGPSFCAETETTEQRIKKLEEDVAQLRKELANLREEVKNSSARGARVAEDLQDIKNILRDLANKQSAITRQAAYGPSPSGAAAATTGTITVQNTYSAAATVRINGPSYR